MKPNKPDNSNIDITYKNYRAVNRNANPSKKGIVCFAELKSFQLKNFKNLKIKKFITVEVSLNL